jgi:hypothetical protein
MLSVSELRELAGKASRGPWFLDAGNMSCGVTQGTGPHDRGHYITDETTTDNGRYIAACDPDTITSILDRLEAAEAALRKVHDMIRLSKGYELEECNLVREAVSEARQALSPTPKG